MQSADYQLTCDKKQISPKHNVFAKMDRLQGTLNADSSTVAEGVQCSTMQVTVTQSLCIESAYC